MSHFENYSGQRTLREDGTYIIDLNGLPYHVINKDPLFVDCANDFKQNKKLWKKEPSPAALPRNIEIKMELSRIDAEYRTQRTIAAAALGDTFAIRRLEEAEKLCAPLRAELETTSNE